MVPGARRRQRLVSWAKAVSMQAHIKWEWTNKQSILQGIGDARIGNNGCWNSGTMTGMEIRRTTITNGWGEFEAIVVIEGLLRRETSQGQIMDDGMPECHTYHTGVIALRN